MSLEDLNSTLTDVFDSFWSWAVLPLLIALGLYFTARSGFVQLRLFPEMLRTLRDRTPRTEDGEPQSLSPFQAFTVSAASRVGVGNIAGVATAIAVGGPGAVFWMWLMALLGGASSFVESTLAQLYKVPDREGFRGGPAYYMSRGLKAPWMGKLFAVVLIACFPLAFNSLQANTIATTLGSTASGAFGEQSLAWLPWAVGLLLAALTAAVIFGGSRRIAHVTETLVPGMAVVYLLLGLVVIGVHIDRLPGAVAVIFAHAFGFQQFAGAVWGQVVLTGIKRGMFSNEAGLGSAPNAGASAAVTHPVKQGLVQTLGVYFDTFLICSVTAFIILVSVPDPAGAGKGIELTQTALAGALGSWTGVLLSVIVFLLAFSSVLGNYFYGESNLEFLTTSRRVLTVYRGLVVAVVLLGSVAATDLVWTIADGIMGVMAITNLVAIGLLSGIAFRLLRDYTEQRKRGVNPVFTRDRLPELDGVECWRDERSVTGPVELPGAQRTP